MAQSSVLISTAARTQATPALYNNLVNDVSELYSGWVAVDDWVYVSAFVFTVPGDQTNTYVTSLRLGWTGDVVPTPLKRYGIVLSSSYNIGTNLTTVNMIPGDFSGISSTNNDFDRRISLAECPPEFRYWFGYIPTITGYSALPADTVYRFCVSGRKMTVVIREGADGTSNATTLTMTAPVTSANITNAAWGAPARVTNNSTPSTTFGVGLITANSNIITFSTNALTATAWTASGGKRIISCTLEFEF